MENTTGNVYRVNAGEAGEVSIDTFTCTAIIIINIAAFTLNTFVIAVIRSRHNLRKLTSSVFAVNLCCVDIFASVVSLHKCYYIVQHHFTSSANMVYIVSAFLDSMSVYITILAVVAITADKFYSIKYTIHYANYATRLVAVLVAVLSLVLASAWSSVSLVLPTSPLRLAVLVLWRHNATCLYSTVIVFFVIPVTLLAVMSVAVYKVARESKIKMCKPEPFRCQIDDEKRTHTSFKHSAITFHGPTLEKICPVSFNENVSHHIVQVKPEVGINNLDLGQHCDRESCLPSDPGLMVMQSEVSGCFKGQEVGMPVPSSSQSSIPAIAILAVRALTTSPSTVSRSAVTRGRSNKIPFRWPFVRNLAKAAQTSNAIAPHRNVSVVKRDKHFKAIRNLTFPFVYFFFTWGLYFIEGLMHVCDSEYDGRFSIFVGSVVYVSFLVNPVVYIISRRDFREEVTSCWERFQHRAEVAPELPTHDQTFHQFLHATSTL